ncbi:hypothetical protein L9F63_004873, partial [Diploptera punctata]
VFHYNHSIFMLCFADLLGNYRCGVAMEMENKVYTLKKSLVVLSMMTIFLCSPWLTNLYAGQQALTPTLLYFLELIHLFRT